MLGKKQPSSQVTTVVGKDARFEGTLSTDGCIRVEGKVVGKIESQGDVIICESAQVQASIHGRNVTLAGRVEGNIHALKKLEMAKSATLLGDAEYGHLVVALGAHFKGESKPLGQKALSERQKPAKAESAVLSPRSD